MAFTKSNVSETVYYEAQATTASAPTLSTDGQPLRNLLALGVLLEAPANVTLSGTGTAQCYVYDAKGSAAWSRFPDNDLTTTEASGLRRCWLEPVDVVGPRDARIAYKLSGLGMSATHTITFNTQTGNFTVGQVVTGGTSGATGTIAAQVDSGTTGTLYLTGVAGTFQTNETITDPTTGSAKCGGAQTALTCTLYQFGHTGEYPYF